MNLTNNYEGHLSIGFTGLYTSCWWLYTM